MIAFCVCLAVNIAVLFVCIPALSPAIISELIEGVLQNLAPTYTNSERCICRLLDV
jgi:hypothetical protein